MVSENIFLGGDSDLCCDVALGVFGGYTAVISATDVLWARSSSKLTSSPPLSIASILSLM